MARPFAAVVLLAAVLTATLFSGRSFTWCPLAGEACAEHRAAAIDHAADLTSRPTIDAPGHTERWFGEFPDAGRRQAPRVDATAPFALLPAIPAVAIPRFTIAPASRQARAGVLRAPPRAGPHSAAARCASLQVFHC